MSSHNTYTQVQGVWSYMICCIALNSIQVTEKDITLIAAQIGYSSTKTNMLILRSNTIIMFKWQALAMQLHVDALITVICTKELQGKEMGTFSFLTPLSAFCVFFPHLFFSFPSAAPHTSTPSSILRHRSMSQGLLGQLCADRTPPPTPPTLFQTPSHG